MSKNGRTFAIATLGCKVNQYEGQAVRERVAALGWRPVPFTERADLYIVNTCTVTAAADRKCRKDVRRALRRNPRARVIVTGCAAVTSPDLFRNVPGVAAVLTRQQMANVEEFLKTGAPPAPANVFDMGISRFSGHTRAFLRIQDGCDARCTYCIVPLARGPVHSRPLEDIRREAERLVAAGHIEIVLTGIHLGHYGRDMPGEFGLLDAIREVLSVTGIQRLRLSSLEAGELANDILDIASSDPRLCPHFHLPLQSGDDAVLRAMSRPYSAADFLRILECARDRVDDPAITSDVMVGFPGETDAQFESTLRVCRQAGFSRTHIFPFSPRPGTRAASLPDQVPPAVVRERESALKHVADGSALAYKRRFEGRAVRPLVEHRRDPASGLLMGWTERYLRVLFDGPDRLMGQIVDVHIESADGESLRGSQVP